MMEWWSALSQLEQVLYCIAIPATVVLLLQIVLMLFGIGGHSDADSSDADDDGVPDHDFDHDHDFGHDHDHDHGTAHDGLHLLTVRGVVAFLAIGSWVGIAVSDAGTMPWLAVVAALAAGLLALVGVAWLMKQAFRLQQNGNVDLHNAIGLTGEVYVPVGALPTGKVTLVVQERFMELPAVCLEGTLATGTPVIVTEVTNDRTLVVRAK